VKCEINGTFPAAQKQVECEMDGILNAVEHSGNSCLDELAAARGNI